MEADRHFICGCSLEAVDGCIFLHLQAGKQRDQVEHPKYIFFVMQTQQVAVGLLFCFFKAMINGYKLPAVILVFPADAKKLFIILLAEMFHRKEMADRMDPAVEIEMIHRGEYVRSCRMFLIPFLKKRQIKGCAVKRDQRIKLPVSHKGQCCCQNRCFVGSIFCQILLHGDLFPVKPSEANEIDPVSG